MLYIIRQTSAAHHLQCLSSPSFLRASFRSAPIPGTTITVYPTVFEAFWGPGWAAGVGFAGLVVVVCSGSGQYSPFVWLSRLAECSRVAAFDPVDCEGCDTDKRCWSRLDWWWKLALLCRGLFLGSEGTWEQQNDGLLEGLTFDGPLVNLFGAGSREGWGLGGGSGATVSFSGSSSFRRPNFCKASILTTCGSDAFLTLCEDSDVIDTWFGLFTDTLAGIILGFGATTGGPVLDKRACEWDLSNSGSSPETGRCLFKSIVWSIVGHKGVFFVDALFRRWTSAS